MEAGAGERYYRSSDLHSLQSELARSSDARVLQSEQASAGQLRSELAACRAEARRDREEMAALAHSFGTHRGEARRRGGVAVRGGGVRSPQRRRNRIQGCFSVTDIRTNRHKYTYCATHNFYQCWLHLGQRVDGAL